MIQTESTLSRKTIRNSDTMAKKNSKNETPANDDTKGQNPAGWEQVETSTPETPETPTATTPPEPEPAVWADVEQFPLLPEKLYANFIAQAEKKMKEAKGKSGRGKVIRAILETLTKAKLSVFWTDIVPSTVNPSAQKQWMRDNANSEQWEKLSRVFRDKNRAGGSTGEDIVRMAKQAELLTHAELDAELKDKENSNLKTLVLLLVQAHRMKIVRSHGEVKQFNIVNPSQVIGQLKRRVADVTDCPEYLTKPETIILRESQKNLDWEKPAEGFDFDFGTDETENG